MRESDQQLGKPMRAYRDAKANIVALGLGAGDEGCVAYASDIDDFGTFDGANWTWLASPPAVAGYALVSDGVDTWAADQTPAWTGEHSFAAGIAFTGDSGANEITVPDDTAIALELLDAGGLEYVRVVSTNANPYVLIDPAAAGVKVAIGHAMPARLLDVYHASTNILLQVHSGDATAGIELIDPTDTAYLMSVGGYASLGGNPSLHAGNLNVNLANGRVGVGTIGPLAPFEVNGGAADDPLTILDSLSDDDAAFINFKGVSAVGRSKSLTSYAGPWTHAGSLKVQINGTDYWIFYNS